MQSTLILWDTNHASSIEQLTRLITKDWPVVSVENATDTRFSNHSYECNDCRKDRASLASDCWYGYRGKHRVA